MGTVPLCFWVAGSTNQNFPPVAAILSGCFFLLLSGILFIKQKNGLKFYSIPSNLDNKTKNKIIREILREYKWTYIKNEYNYIQVEGTGFRDTLDLRTWSELLTIVVENDKIEINSICNPDGFFPQVFSFGKNKQNIKDFEMHLLRKSTYLLRSAYIQQ
jgi:hypothetical protein